jgi:hypothetical protein
MRKMTRTVVVGLILAFLLFTPQGRLIGVAAIIGGFLWLANENQRHAEHLAKCHYPTIEEGLDGDYNVDAQGNMRETCEGDLPDEALDESGIKVQGHWVYPTYPKRASPVLSRRTHLLADPRTELQCHLSWPGAQCETVPPDGKISVRSWLWAEGAPLKAPASVSR